jgi:sphinganine-1-phosphate aldolase
LFLVGDDRLREIEGISVMGEPDACVVAVESNEFNIYRVSDAMAAKGWSLNPLQFPSSIHICVTYLHTLEGVAQRFIDDIKEIVADIRTKPMEKLGGSVCPFFIFNERNEFSKK